MKTLKHLIYLLLITIAVTGCSRDFDEPPLTPEVYNGPPANTKIAALKDRYKDITDPVMIDVDFIVKAYVSGNDVSGNIYKQLYIQDETGAINIGIDQNNMYTEYRVGQEVFINLHGLYMVKYGGELQIGYGSTSANRIPWLIFNDHTSRNGFPNKANVEPLKVQLGKLTDDMVNKVVLIENIYFVNADGKKTLTTGSVTTNEPISDADGNKLDVRTSSYSTTLAKFIMPQKYGSVIGVLGRYNGGWQLFLRDTDDILTFGLNGPNPTEPEENELFKEKFGTKDLSKVTPKPTYDAYDDFDNKSPIQYTGNGDVRSTTALGNHVWLAAYRDDIPSRNLKIEGLNITGKSNVKLSYDMTANLFDDGSKININALKVKCNGTDLSVPSFEITKDDDYMNKYYTVVISGLPSDITSLEFYTDATNTLGLRIDNITIYVDDTIVPNP